ncbi:Ig-like domain-containing protein [Nocardioides sp. B-3]|uniref:Ig-like domain-containing protein n=1 Tax=Nocardioides sp. B-3 TaxID=2895565 RepID=UPI003FA5ECE2
MARFRRSTRWSSSPSRPPRSRWPRPPPATGAPVTATAKVTTPGGTPDGDVTFVVAGVSTKVPVKDGAASLVIDRAAVGDNAVSATFTPKDAVHYEGSSAGPVNLKVSKAATSTGGEDHRQARARARPPRSRSSASTRPCRPARSSSSCARSATRASTR